MQYGIDASWQRFGRVILAGSPLRLFRVTAAGRRIVERIESGDDVGGSSLVDRLLDAGAVHPRRPVTPGSFSLDDVTVVTPQLGGAVGHHDRITVDDGSQPPLVGATVRLERNQGPAAARNAARPCVTTPLVAFVDADVSTRDPAWLDGLLWHFDDPRVGLVAPRVCGEVGSPLDLGDEPARVRAGTRVSYVPGATLVVRVDAFDAIGGFDEGLRFGEDVDLVWRLDDAGWRCRYDPSVSVWHEPRSTWWSRLRQHAAYGTSAAPLAVRHPRALSPLHVNGWTAVAWTVAAVGHPIAAATIVVGSSAVLIRRLPDVPARASFVLAARGHVLAGQQIASAIRRTWWPIVAVGALVSRRCRWIGVLAVAADVRSAPTDVAYGWGVWTSMWRTRTWAPIVPRLSAWPQRRPPQPGREPSRRHGSRDEHPRAPGGDAR